MKSNEMEAPVFLERVSTGKVCHLVDQASRRTVCNNIAFTGRSLQLGDSRNNDAAAVRVLSSAEVPGELQSIQSHMATPCEKCFVEEGW